MLLTTEKPVEKYPEVTGSPAWTLQVLETVPDEALAVPVQSAVEYVEKAYVVVVPD
jgi:hypothetical protein